MNGLYSNQNAQYVFGNSTTPITLTDDGADNNKILAIGNPMQVIFYVLYTPAADGSLIQISVRFSPKNIDNAIAAPSAIDDMYITQDTASTTTSGLTAVVCTPQIHRIAGATTGVDVLARLAFPTADGFLGLSAFETAADGSSAPASYGTFTLITQASGLS